MFIINISLKPTSQSYWPVTVKKCVTKIPDDSRLFLNNILAFNKYQQKTLMQSL